MLPNDGNGNMKSNPNLSFYELMDYAISEFKKILNERNQFQAQLTECERKSKNIFRILIKLFKLFNFLLIIINNS